MDKTLIFPAPTQPGNKAKHGEEQANYLIKPKKYKYKVAKIQNKKLIKSRRSGAASVTGIAARAGLDKTNQGNGKYCREKEELQKKYRGVVR